MKISELEDIYRVRFRSEPRLFRAPGRINLIGEHTDYNNGFVLPAAVDKEIWMLMAPNNLEVCKIYSHDFDEYVEFNRKNYRNVPYQWSKYIVGIIDQLKRKNLEVGGFDCVFCGDIPFGAGMSSSAALECATIVGLNELFGFGLSKMEMAVLAQKAENDFVGVNCGIMDQYASLISEPDYFLKIDCQELTFEKFKIDLSKHELILFNSMVKHTLVETEYNNRRQECESAIRKLNKAGGDFKSLRDVSLGYLELNRSQLDRIEYRRAKYVIEESLRVNKACEAIKKNDLNRLGELLYRSHEGLQFEYQVSCKELDFLVNATEKHEEVLGARMMGGGFGGCTINLMEAECADQVVDEICEDYLLQFGFKPEVYKVKTTNGASEKAMR